jgi:hypothetical protein
MQHTKLRAKERRTIRDMLSQCTLFLTKKQEETTPAPVAAAKNTSIVVFRT